MWCVCGLGSKFTNKSSKTAVCEKNFVQYGTQLCVNNIEVTVNTCTCTDVLTVITTRDQSGGIYRTGGQGFMVVSQHASSSGSLTVS